MMQHPQN